MATLLAPALAPPFFHGLTLERFAFGVSLCNPCTKKARKRETNSASRPRKQRLRHNVAADALAFEGRPFPGPYTGEGPLPLSRAREDHCNASRGGFQSLFSPRRTRRTRRRTTDAQATPRPPCNAPAVPPPDLVDPVILSGSVFTDEKENEGPRAPILDSPRALALRPAAAV